MDISFLDDDILTLVDSSSLEARLHHTGSWDISRLDQEVVRLLLLGSRLELDWRTWVQFHIISHTRGRLNLVK